MACSNVRVPNTNSTATVTAGAANQSLYISCLAFYGNFSLTFTWPCQVLLQRTFKSSGRWYGVARCVIATPSFLRSWTAYPWKQSFITSRTTDPATVSHPRKLESLATALWGLEILQVKWQLRRAWWVGSRQALWWQFHCSHAHSCTYS